MNKTIQSTRATEMRPEYASCYKDTKFAMDAYTDGISFAVCTEWQRMLSRLINTPATSTKAQAEDWRRLEHMCHGAALACTMVDHPEQAEAYSLLSDIAGDRYWEIRELYHH